MWNKVCIDLNRRASALQKFYYHYVIVSPLADSQGALKRLWWVSLAKLTHPVRYCYHTVVFCRVKEDDKPVDAETPAPAEDEYSESDERAIQVLNTVKQAFEDLNAFEQRLARFRLDPTSDWRLLLEVLAPVAYGLFSFLLTWWVLSFTVIGQRIASYDTPRFSYSRAAFFVLFILFYILAIIIRNLTIGPFFVE